METIIITQETNLDKIVTLINGHRLSHKNQWWQAMVHFEGFDYKIKAYNTWIQIFRKEKEGTIINDSPGAMDVPIKQFKQQIINRLKP